MMPTAVFAEGNPDVDEATKPTTAVSQTDGTDLGDSTGATQTDDSEVDTVTTDGDTTDGDTIDGDTTEPTNDTEESEKVDGSEDTDGTDVVDGENETEITAEDSEAYSANDAAQPAAAPKGGFETGTSEDGVFSVEFFRGTISSTDLTVIAVDEENEVIDTLHLGDVYASTATMTVALTDESKAVYEITDVSGGDGVYILDWNEDFKDGQSVTFGWADTLEGIKYGTGTIYVHMKAASHVLNLQNADKDIDLGTILWKEDGNAYQRTTVEAYLNYELVYRAEDLPIANTGRNFILDVNDGYYFDTVGLQNIKYSSDIDGQSFSYAAPYTRLTFNVVPSSIVQGNNVVKLYFFDYSDATKVDFNRRVDTVDVSKFNHPKACENMVISFESKGKTYSFLYEDWDFVALPRNTQITISPNIAEGYYFQYWNCFDAAAPHNSMYSILEDGTWQLEGDGTAFYGLLSLTKTLGLDFHENDYPNMSIYLCMTQGKENNDKEILYNSNYPEEAELTDETYSQYYYNDGVIARGVRILDDMFQPEGYELLYWTTNKDGSGDIYMPNDLYGNKTSCGDLTLYAQWKKIGEPETPPQKPDDPTVEALLKDAVTVQCTNSEATHDETEKIYDVLEDCYEVSDVKGNATDGYTVDVTVLKSVYLAAFNDDTGIKHTLDPVTQNDPVITLCYVAESKTWEVDSKTPVPVIITVTCKDAVKADIIVTPENLTIYRGGEKTEETGSNVNIVNGEGKELENDGSLPEIGFSLQLSTELNNRLRNNLGVESDTVLDLSDYITLTAKTTSGQTLIWDLTPYGEGTSATNAETGYYIYKIVPTDDSDGAKLNVSFRDKEGNYVGTDDFDIQDHGTLAETYTMMIYGDRVDASTLYATITYDNGKTETASVQGAEDPATLTVRYTNEDATVTQSYNTVAEASKAEDGNNQSQLTKSAYMIRGNADHFMVNNSDVQVDGQHVSLLFDDIAETTDTHYADTLNKKAIEAVKQEDSDVDTSKLKTEAKYLDLVDATNGNVWVTTGNKQVTIYWPFPEGTDASTTFYVAHFDGLDRNDDVDGMTEAVNKATASMMNVETDQYGVYFTTSSFSPYVLVWDTTTTSGGGGSHGGGDGGTTNNNNNTNNNTTTVNVTSTAVAQPQATTAAIPQTGDAMPVGLLGGLAAAAAAGFAALFVIRKRKQNG